MKITVSSHGVHEFPEWKPQTAQLAQRIERQARTGRDFRPSIQPPPQHISPILTAHPGRAAKRPGKRKRSGASAAESAHASRLAGLGLHHALLADPDGTFGSEVAGEEVLELAVEADGRFFVAEPVALAAL